MSSAGVGWFKKAENIWLLFSFLLGTVNLFLILLLWNVTGAEPKPDSLSVSLTVLEIFLAVIAVSGFFLIRSAAIKAAEDEARSEAARIAPIAARRAAMSYLSLLEQRNGGETGNDSLHEMMMALDEENDDGR